MKEAQKQAQAIMEQDEQRRRQQHEQLQRALEIQLREAEDVSLQLKKKKKQFKFKGRVNFFVFCCVPQGSGQYAGRDGSEGRGSREAKEEDPGAGGDAEAFGGGSAAGD